MDEPSAVEFDEAVLEAMNEKEVRNQFFTPDKAYIELGLFKDFPIGAIYADIVSRDLGETVFDRTQRVILNVLDSYQSRLYDTVNGHFQELGYDDQKIEELLNNQRLHNAILMMAPNSHFLNLLIRHTLRNQNHSRPANKYTKVKLGKDKYTLKPVDITYYINTYPLTISPNILASLGEELGEPLGVNIKFINQDPLTFSSTDWDSWLKEIDCFYLDSLGRFGRAPLVVEKMGNMEFVGRFIFARKRFEKDVMADMVQMDLENEIQLATARMDIFSDFVWLLNSDICLTDPPERVEEEQPFTPPGMDMSHE